MIPTLLKTHLRWLLANPQLLATLLLYAAAITLAALLTLHDAPQQALAAASTLWIVLPIAGLIASARTITEQHATGGLQGLLLAPIHRRDLFLTQALTTALLVLTMSLATWLTLIPLFPTLPGPLNPLILAPLVPAALTFGTLGTFTGWAALTTPNGELLATLLAIPLAAPLIIAGFHATHRLIQATTGWEASLTFATGYALALTALAYLVADPIAQAP